MGPAMICIKDGWTHCDEAGEELNNDKYFFYHFVGHCVDHLRKCTH